MLFSSFAFLAFFLPLTVLVYFVLPTRLQNAWLLLTSIFFYSWGGPTFVALLIASSLFDYLLSLGMQRSAKLKRSLLVCSIFLNVGLLAYFKYANFFVEQLQAVQLIHHEWVKVILPIGISFFTFHKISYVVDVYRGASKGSRNVIDYLLYITFFPQLIAGPIIRYHEIESFLKSRSATLSDVYEGATRFSLGLAKKVLIADPCGVVANNVYSMLSTSVSTANAWLAAIAYSVQLYFDFSGYSDMAIGLARMFGFRFPENFNHPYLAINFTDFWRRWHMSLSRWMKDYLYIPLGGNRLGPVRTYINLSVVFLLSGLWHGANWTFILWGAYHGLFLILDRLGLEDISKKMPRPVARAATLFFVVLGWVLFRSASLSQASFFLRAMVLPVTYWDPKHYVPYGLIISPYAAFTLCVALILVFFGHAISRALARWSKLSSPALCDAATLVLVVLSLISLQAGRFSPFIYFQF